MNKLKKKDTSIEWKTFADTFVEPSFLTEFEWKIENFTFLTNEVDEFYESPQFSSPGYSWCLRLYPHGESVQKSDEWMGLYLMMCQGYGCVVVDYIIGIERTDGSREFKKGLSNVCFAQKFINGWIKFLKRDELLQRKSEYYPSDVLTISISIRHQIPEHIKPKKSPIKVGNVRTKGAWKKTSDIKGLTLLSDSLRKVFVDEEDSDINIIVKGRIIRAHKLILKARSEVLLSMLTHDMLENNNNEIKIDDCEPGAFEVFLLYLYTGKVEKISDSNMLDVLHIADKYDVSDLKTECISYIKCSMSVKDICTIFCIALKYDDLALLECATHYFIENIHEILVTDEWKLFLKDNPTFGNELYIKAFKKRKI